MTRKLSNFEKQQNKFRRQSLKSIEKLLKDKSISATITVENIIEKLWLPGDRLKITDTGKRKLTLEWSEKHG